MVKLGFFTSLTALSCSHILHSFFLISCLMFLLAAIRFELALWRMMRMARRATSWPKMTVSVLLVKWPTPGPCKSRRSSGTVPPLASASQLLLFAAYLCWLNPLSKCLILSLVFAWTPVLKYPKRMLDISDSRDWRDIKFSLCGGKDLGHCWFCCWWEALL